jgi:hypothetical protein
LEKRGFEFFCSFYRALGGEGCFIQNNTNGERFAGGLSSNNLFGHYFDALQLTGHYPGHSPEKRNNWRL